MCYQRRNCRVRPRKETNLFRGFLQPGRRLFEKSPTTSLHSALKEEKPDILQKSQEFSNQLKESFSFIRKQSINYLKQNHNRIDRPSFLQLDTALQKDILCLLFETHDLHKNQEIVTWILHLLHTTTGNKKITLQQGHCFIIEYEKGFITKPDEKKQFEAVSLCLSETVHWEKNRFYFSKKCHKIMQSI